jgi:tetratricopeptide (TPR) repeat protein
MGLYKKYFNGDQRVRYAVLFLFLIFFSCANESYENRLIKYLNYLKAEKYDKAYSLLSKTDQNAVTLEEFSSNLSSIDRVIVRKTSNKVLESSTSESGSSVTVTVEVKKIDMRKLFLNIPELAVDKKLSVKEVEKIMNKNRNNLNKCVVIFNKDYKLINEEDKWVIKADLDIIKYINDNLKSAIEYEKAGEYDKAMSAIEKIIDYEEVDRKAVDIYSAAMEKNNYKNNYLKLSYQIESSTIVARITNTGTYALKELSVKMEVYDNGALKDEALLTPISKEKEKTLGYNESAEARHTFENLTPNDKIKVYVMSISF